MDRTYPQHPLTAAVAVVTRGDRVVLVRRGKTAEPDRWGFPGGLVELGETVREAARRELAEETGIRAEAVAVMDTVDVIVPDPLGRIRHHFVLTVVRMRWLAGEAVPASDAVAAQWFSLDDIATLACHPQVARLAAEALSAIPKT